MRIKSLLYVALLLIVNSSLLAQSHFGIKGGYTNAWPDYGTIAIPDNAQTDVSGFNISMLYYLPISNLFHIGIEPGFVKRGAACFPGWQPRWIGDTKVHLNYVELPLMASFNMTIPKTKIAVYANVGYGASILISAMQELIALGNKVEPIKSRINLNAPNNRIERFDHGFYSALGISYQISHKGKLILESNFYLGMNNYDKIDFAKNRSLNISMGYVNGF